MRNLVVFIIDLLVVLIAVGCTIYGVAMTGEGASFFCMYTRLSNLIAAVTCALSLPYDFRALREARGAAASGPVEMPGWLRVLRLAGVSTVMVTFVTVFLFLGFAVGHLALLHDTNFFFHLVSPLLMLAGCVLARSSADLPTSSIALPVLLTAAYAAWYFVEVIVIGPDAGGWHDFYGFNTGGMWPVSMVAMLAVSALVALACRKLSK